QDREGSSGRRSGRVLCQKEWEEFQGEGSAPLLGLEDEWPAATGFLRLHREKTPGNSSRFTAGNVKAKLNDCSPARPTPHPRLGRLRQEDRKLEASLGNLRRLCLHVKTGKGWAVAAWYSAQGFKPQY
ncbi:hypothetical protein H1C71_035025, partial [Ictidomys tridecemlineatus]